MSDSKDERRARLETDRERRAAAREGAAELQGALAEAAGTVAQALQPFILAAVKMLQVVANDPVVRFAMDHPELLSTERPKPCHCWCGRLHPGELGICAARAVTTRHFTTDPTGGVDVDLCAPCAVAQGLAESSP